MSKKTKLRKGKFNLRYLTREGFRNVRTHKLMTVASITVMVSCLILIGGAYLVWVNIQSVIDRVGEQNVIMVFVQDEATKEQEKQLQDQLNSIPNVSSVEYVSREESFSRILYNMGPSAGVMSGMEADFLPNAFKVRISDMDAFPSTVQTIQTLKNVLTVRQNGELASKLSNIQHSISLMGIAVAVILFAVSLFIIANTVRITMFSRSLEISIMKAVGATNRFIRWPFMTEGVIIGIISAIIAYAIIFLMYFGAQKVFAETFAILGNQVIPFEDNMWILAIAYLAVGILTGAFGSGISLARYLKEHGKVVDNE